MLRLIVDRKDSLSIDFPSLAKAINNAFDRVNKKTLEDVMRDCTEFRPGIRLLQLTNDAPSLALFLRMAVEKGPSDFRTALRWIRHATKKGSRESAKLVRDHISAAVEEVVKPLGYRQVMKCERVRAKLVKTVGLASGDSLTDMVLLKSFEKDRSMKVSIIASKALRRKWEIEKDPKTVRTLFADWRWRYRGRFYTERTMMLMKIPYGADRAEIAREWLAQPSKLGDEERMLRTLSLYEKGKSGADVKREYLIKLFNSKEMVRKVAALSNEDDDVYTDAIRAIGQSLTPVSKAK